MDAPHQIAATDLAGWLMVGRAVACLAVILAIAWAFTAVHSRKPHYPNDEDL